MTTFGCTKPLGVISRVTLAPVAAISVDTLSLEVTAVWVVAFVDVCVAVDTCTSRTTALESTHKVDTHWRVNVTITGQFTFVYVAGAVFTRVARRTAASVASWGAQTFRPVPAGVAKATVVKLTVVAAYAERTLAL